MKQIPERTFWKSQEAASCPSHNTPKQLLEASHHQDIGLPPPETPTYFTIIHLFHMKMYIYHI